jgi:hypothetical protein
MLLGLKLGQCHSELYTLTISQPITGGKGESVHTVNGGTACFVRVQLLSEIRVKQLPVFGCGKE